MLGMQFLVPGVLVWFATALLPYTAAEPGVGIGRALGLSVRRIAVAPLAWVASLGGLLCSVWVGMAVLYVGADDPTAAMFDPHTASLGARAASNVARYGIYGLSLILGAALYHRAVVKS
jgi:hypothetical protein